VFEIPDQLDLEAKFEVIVFLFSRQEHVVRDISLERAPNNGSSFDPKPVQITLPSSKSLTVEDGDENSVRWDRTDFFDRRLTTTDQG
jgi:hypothetical protein